MPPCDTDSGALCAKSYADTPARAQAVSAVLLALSVQIQKALEDQNSPAVRSLVRTLAPSFCIFSITHLQEQPWTNAASRRSARELLTSAVGLTGSRSVQELLSGAERSSGATCPLFRESWKRNQPVKHVFSWVLVQVGRPWLTEYLEKVFPPSLLISDDYYTENKVLGVHCLHHIVLNVVVLPCLLDLLSVLEKSPVHSGLPRKPNRFDDVLRHVLTYMEMEHKLDLRCVYAKNLVLFIERMGIVIVRHLKRLERVIVGYLEVSDAPEEKARLSILDALQKTTDCLATSLPTQLKEQLITQASHCLLLLDHCSKVKLQVRMTIIIFSIDFLWLYKKEFQPKG
uniref:TELO2 interacting protein 2 n=1 Tax=Sinocyclocheilus anshuiensis TaxID=1608454 RepID=A0A671S6U6_9TELE